MGAQKGNATFSANISAVILDDAFNLNPSHYSVIIIHYNKTIHYNAHPLQGSIYNHSNSNRTVITGKLHKILGKLN
jgi:hypothetical protein